MPWKELGGWLWKRLNDLSTIAWLFGLFGASTVTSRAISLMPSGWHPPQYWALSFAWFFGTLFLIVGTAQALRALWNRAHPPRLDVTTHGGEDASLVVCP